MKMPRFKTIMLITVLILLGVQLVAVVGCSNKKSDTANNDKPETANNASATKLPKAVFPETKYNFASIEEGTNIEHDFVIENHGQAPLVIEKVQPD